MFYVGQAGGPPQTATSANLSDGEMVVQPVVIPFTMDVSKIRFEITVAGTGDWYVVVYDSNEDGYPNALLYESTAISIASTGIKVASPPALTLEQERLYWVGVLADTTVTPTIRRRANWIGAISPRGLSDADLVNFSLGQSVPIPVFRDTGLAPPAPNPFNASVGAGTINDTPIMTIELS
jgi:hypothetical protein